jgi:hypothetical protein
LKDTINSITPDTITSMFFSVLRQLSAEPDNSPRLVISPTLPPEVRRELRQAIREQATLGWPLLLHGYMAKSWTSAYSKLSGNCFKSDATKSWSTTIINCYWTYAFDMWKLRCKILNEDELGIKFTKMDNKIRALCQEKDSFLPIDRTLFALHLARVLAQTAKTKEACLLGFRAAKQRLEAYHDPENLENVVNPANRRKRKPNAKKPKTTTTHTVSPTLFTLMQSLFVLTHHQTHASWHFSLFAWPSSSCTSLRVQV